MKKHVLTIIILTITTSWLKAQTIELWGLASSGGQDTSGVIFKVSSTGTLTAEYSFKDYYSGDTDGQNPSGSLLEANDGLLYGLTSKSSVTNYGAIFRCNTATNTEKVLHFFNAYDGAEPTGTFIQANNGLLYATTSSEGAYDAGSVISYDISTGVTADVYDFADNNDGNSPYGSLCQASDSLLYGLTSSDDINGAGEIFSIDPANNNQYTVLYNFVNNDTDGVRPYGSLIQATNGLLYGMTSGAGIYHYGGIIFSYNITTHKKTTLWSFGANNDGALPLGSLIQVKGNDSLLFGLTNGGDSNTDGTIFSFNINTGLEQTLHVFALDGHEGFFPEGSLMQASDGKLYGTTSQGGANDDGTIFNYDISTGTETTVTSFNGANGSNPYGDLIEVTSTGINQLTVDRGQLTVYPNPSSDFIHTTIQLNHPSNLQLRLVNMLGKTLWVTDAGTVSSYQNNISVADLPDGVYLLEMVTGGGMESKEVVVAR